MPKDKLERISECLGYYSADGPPKVVLATEDLGLAHDIVGFHEQTHRALEEGSTVGCVIRLLSLLLKCNKYCRHPLPREISLEMRNLAGSLQVQTAMVHESLATYLGLVLGACDATEASAAFASMPESYRQAADGCIAVFGTFEDVFADPEHLLAIVSAAYDTGLAALNVNLRDAPTSIAGLRTIGELVAADSPNVRFAKLLACLDPPPAPGPLSSFLSEVGAEDLMGAGDRPARSKDPYPSMTRRWFHRLRRICPSVSFVSDRCELGSWAEEFVSGVLNGVESLGSDSARRITPVDFDSGRYEAVFVDAEAPEWVPLDKSLLEASYPERAPGHFITFCSECAKFGYMTHVFMLSPFRFTSTRTAEFVPLAVDDHVAVAVRAQKATPNQADPPASVDVSPFSTILHPSLIDDVIAQHPTLEFTLRTDERFVPDPQSYFKRWVVPAVVLLRDTTTGHFLRLVESLAEQSEVCVMMLVLDKQVAAVAKPRHGRIYYASPMTLMMVHSIMLELESKPMVTPYRSYDDKEHFGIDFRTIITVLRGAYLGLDALQHEYVVPRQPWNRVAIRDWIADQSWPETPEHPAPQKPDCGDDDQSQGSAEEGILEESEDSPSRVEPAD